MKTYQVFNGDNEVLHPRVFEEEIALRIARNGRGWVLENEWAIVSSRQIGDFREQSGN